MVMSSIMAVQGNNMGMSSSNRAMQWVVVVRFSCDMEEQGVEMWLFQLSFSCSTGRLVGLKAGTDAVTVSSGLGCSRRQC